MPARTGQEYITGLKEHPREVWIDGERVQDVTTHPALRNGVRSVAVLYDMQYDPELQEEMTYPSPTTGQPVGLSFLVPRSMADLERRRHMMARWAWASCGMMGRSPDFLNVLFTAWAGAADYFAQNRPEFKPNVLNYYFDCLPHWVRIVVYISSMEPIGYAASRDRNEQAHCVASASGTPSAYTKAPHTETPRTRSGQCPDESAAR